MATKPSEDGQGKQQEVIDELHKAGTLKRSTVVHVSPAESKETVVNQPDCVNPNGWKLLALEERRIVLSDNTQIIVESQNEFIFIGPDSSKIVLSCLPLFCVPDQVTQDTTISSVSVNQPLETSGISSSSSTSSLQKNNGWISFTQSMMKQNSITKLPDEEGVSGSNTDGIETELPPLDQELPGDLFTIVDPFEGQPTDSFSGAFEESTRNKQIDDAFAKATNPGTTAVTNNASDDGGCSDSDDDNVGNNGSSEVQINYVPDVKAVNKLRSASVSFVTMNQVSRSRTMIATPLPPPPPTVFPRYTERGGWLIKLSHQKGMFGDRWQKRYFILNGPRLSYFKKYGDSQPRGVVNLIPGSWCRSIPQGTPRMSDAVAKSNRSGVITVNRCLAVHKPSNYASTLSAMVASEGVADAFNSQTIALSNPQDSSRTFYMIAASEQERHAWTDAINENINAYKRSQEAVDVACGELRNVLKAVGSCVPVEDLPSILLAVHSKKAAMFNVSPT